MVPVTCVNLVGVQIGELPAAVTTGVLIVFGWIIGQGITVEVLRSLLDRAGYVLAAASLLLAFEAGLAFIAVRLGVLDPATSFLATSPGGLAQMTALSEAIGADTAFVVALHTLRVILVVALSRVILRFLPSP